MKKNNKKKNKRANVQVSPATNQISLRDLSIDNMASFYLSLAKWIPKNCPAVIVLKQLPNEEYIHWEEGGNRKIALLSQDIPDIQKLELVMAGPLSTDSHNFKKTNIASSCPEYSAIYGTAAMISDSLSMRCPQILVLENLPKQYSGFEHNDGNCPIAITIKNSLPFGSKVRTLAHEMRHAWQQITNPEYYSANYHIPMDKGIDDHMQQIAEVDAEAFSRAVCHFVFGTPIQINRFSADTDQLINELAEKMVASPLDYGISVPGGSGGQRRPVVA